MNSPYDLPPPSVIVPLAGARLLLHAEPGNAQAIQVSDGEARAIEHDGVADQRGAAEFVEDETTDRLGALFVEAHVERVVDILNECESVEMLGHQFVFVSPRHRTPAPE